ncbi:MAG: hypothetical protein ABL861_02625 [Nitrosomonas sp.]
MTEAPVAALDVFAIEQPPRPYPGLRPFQRQEWLIFFGRERMIDTAIELLIKQRLLFVHGDSGCGKSSLARAGMLPRLEQDNARGGICWRTCISEPGERPLWNIAQSLASLDGPDRDSARTIEFRRVLNFGAQAPSALAELLCLSRNNSLCILIDQFEELFAQATRHGPEEARLLTEFLNSLLAAPPDGLYVVVTMRSEFLGQCARHGNFAETVNTTQYLLPRMSHADMVRAICEPAMLYGGEVTHELAERLIADAGGGQDELPLIQHGLMQLYNAMHCDELRATRLNDVAVADDRTPCWRLGIEHYQHKGRLAGLLSDHADEVQAVAERKYEGARQPARVVEDLFRALTEINADGAAIRRPQTLKQLTLVCGCDEGTLRGVIDEFRIDGISFLRPYLRLHGNDKIDLHERIDISHEALIRCWQHIADSKNGWLAHEFRDGLVWRALLVQAESFDRNSANVLAPETTDERVKWLECRNAAWAERYGGGWDSVRKLINASVENAAEEKRLKIEQLLIETKGRRLLIGLSLMGFMLIFIVIVALFVMEQRNYAVAEAERATNYRSIAEAQAKETAIALEQTEVALEQAKIDRKQLQDQIQLVQIAQKQAEQTQASAAQTYAISVRDVDTEQILKQLEEDPDPYTLSVFIQGLADSARKLSVEQSSVLIEQLLTKLTQSSNPSAIAAMSQAISAFTSRLSSRAQYDAISRALELLTKSNKPGGLIAVTASLVDSIPEHQLQVLVDSTTKENARLLLYALRTALLGASSQDAARLHGFEQVLATYSALPRPQLLILIAEDSQRKAIQALSSQLSSVSLFNDKIELLPVDIVSPIVQHATMMKQSGIMNKWLLPINTPSRTVLRCFRLEECLSDGSALLDTLKRVLRIDDVVLEDYSDRLTDSMKAKARYYELRFAPGAIGLPSVEISLSQLIAIMPTAAPIANQWIDPLNDAMKHFEINNAARVAAFLAQIAHESRELRSIEENLNYSSNMLLKIFRHHFVSSEQAQNYARNPERIANRIYRDRMGNSSEESGDGWRYRLRGLFGIIGRNSYREFGEVIGIDIKAEPDRVLEPAIASLVGAWYWNRLNLNRIADADDENAILLITKRIKGGSIGLEDRLAYWHRARTVLGLGDVGSSR